MLVGNMFLKFIEKSNRKKPKQLTRPKEERMDGAFHRKLLFRSVTPSGQRSGIKQTK